MPIEIHLRFLCKPDVDGEGWANLLQLICDHMGHCRHLCIKDGDDDGLPELLLHISRRPTPLLSSVELSIDDDDDFARLTEISKLSFLSGTPHLTSAKIGKIASASILSNMPTLQHLTSLWLSLSIGQERFEGLSFWDALMALKALDHLELEIMEDMVTHAPVVLPTVRSLALTIHHWYPEIPDDLFFSIHAPSVTTLWLECQPLDHAFEGSLEFHFPSMRHLILVNVDIRMMTWSIPGFSRIFSTITRLTYHFTDMDMVPFTIDDFLVAMVPHSIGILELRWPKLHTVALDEFNTSLGYKGLHDKIQVLQEARHPIRKLMLPKRVLGKPKDEEIMALEKIVELEDFSLDWPSPFVDTFK